MYKIEDANKLTDAFLYLIGDTLFPAGNRGERFEIYGFEVKLKPREGAFFSRQADESRDPEGKIYESEPNWNVFAKLKGDEGSQKSIELSELLDFMKIKYSFNILLKNDD